MLHFVYMMQRNKGHLQILFHDRYSIYNNVLKLASLVIHYTSDDCKMHDSTAKNMLLKNHIIFQLHE